MSRAFSQNLRKLRRTTGVRKAGRKCCPENLRKLLVTVSKNVLSFIFYEHVHVACEPAVSQCIFILSPYAGICYLRPSINLENLLRTFLMTTIRTTSTSEDINGKNQVILAANVCSYVHCDDSICSMTTAMEWRATVEIRMMPLLKDQGQ